MTQPLGEQDTNANNKKINNQNGITMNMKPNTNNPAITIKRTTTPDSQKMKAKEPDSSGAKRLAEFKRRLQERHINAAKNKEN